MQKSVLMTPCNHHLVKINEEMAQIKSVRQWEKGRCGRRGIKEEGEVWAEGDKGAGAGGGRGVGGERERRGGVGGGG